MQIVGERKIAFYHLEGEYVYSEYDMNKYNKFHGGSVNVWKERRFARKVNGDRYVLL